MIVGGCDAAVFVVGPEARSLSVCTTRHARSVRLAAARASRVGKVKPVVRWAGVVVVVAVAKVLVVVGTCHDPVPPINLTVLAYLEQLLMDYADSHGEPMKKEKNAKC